LTGASSRTLGHHIQALGGGMVFAASVLYFAASYVGRFGAVPDSPAGAAAPVLTNVLLLVVFAVHHSVFARPSAKALLARIVPADMERSVYVWIASGLFAALTALWQPVPGVLWRFDPPWNWPLHAVQIAGLVIAVDAGRRMDVGVLSGVRQAIRPTRRQAGVVVDSGPYRVVRHPLHLALLLLVWPMPLMTGTRFVFACAATVYLLIAIPFEERDLHRTFGDAYARYAARVRARLLPGIY
jgi:protein-S-isoprenylcysteine O-methyltransferase Ste14